MTKTLEDLIEENAKLYAKIKRLEREREAMHRRAQSAEGALAAAMAEDDAKMALATPPHEDEIRRPKAAATEICPDCKGSGEYADWGGECPLCGGTGGAPAYRAAPSSGQEQTVAWRWTDNNGKTWRVDNTKPEPAFGRWIEPLYATPPSPSPMEK